MKKLVSPRTRWLILSFSLSCVFAGHAFADNLGEGLLSPLTVPLADHGIALHATAIDFSEANPSVGLVTNRATTSLYVILGSDIDLGKLLGLSGTSLHFENTYFPATRNLNIAAQMGDSQIGYEPAYTPRATRLSLATIEQKMLGDSVDIEVGITHPAYHYAQFNCGEINNCFQEILFINARYPSYIFGVPGGNITYHMTPDLYIQGGAFAIESNANSHLGYDFIDRSYDGALIMQEIGLKTDFSHVAYPYKISVTGFVNNVSHLDYDAASADGAATRSVKGTSGIVVMSDKTVWRKDGGADISNTSPTSLKIYGSAGLGLDTTMPIHSDVFVGATVLAPFSDRPKDSYGLKVMWERLNSRYERYLTEANHVSGGTATSYSQDTFVFEMNAHFQLPMGMVFEPTVQYAVEPNSYYNPFTSKQAQDGVYIAGTVVIPFGAMLGM